MSGPLTEIELVALRALHAAYVSSQWTSYVNQDGSTTVKADKDASPYLHALIQTGPRMFVELERVRALLRQLPIVALKEHYEFVRDVRAYLKETE